MKKILLPLILILSFISCVEEQKADTENQVPVSKELRVDKNDNNWGGDIILNIESTEKISPEVTAYKIVSSYKGKPVGFIMKVKQPAKKNLFVSEGVTFLSLKDTSDNFLKTLAEIYEVKIATAAFTDSLTITYADLMANADVNKPGNWAAAQKKLFFETDDDTPELFLNIDEAAGTISFPEKDKDYRGGIIQALSKKTK